MSSGYLEVKQTYTSTSIMPPNAAMATLDRELQSTEQKITPFGEYQVSVHPNPFQYYALQHGQEPSNAYFNIRTAYNGDCSSSAFRACTGTTITKDLPTPSPTPTTPTATPFS